MSVKDSIVFRWMAVNTFVWIIVACGTFFIGQERERQKRQKDHKESFAAGVASERRWLLSRNLVLVDTEDTVHLNFVKGGTARLALYAGLEVHKYFTCGEVRGRYLVDLDGVEIPVVEH